MTSFSVMWELFLPNIYHLSMFQPFQIGLHLHNVDLFLKLLAQHYEKISPLYFLSVLLSGFLPFLKTTSGLEDQEGFSAFEYQCCHLSHINAMGVEYRS